MSSHTVPVHRASSSSFARVRSLVARAHSESALAIGAISIVGLHVADDNFLQPNAGTAASDHLVSGFVPLALLAGAAAAYPRLRAGYRSLIAFLAGFLGLLGGVEAFHYGRTVGLSGDDYTGVLSIAAGFVLVGVSAVTLWRTRRRNDRIWWRYTRRLVLTFVAAFSTMAVLFPIAISYVVTHAARAEVPPANLGAPYEDVEFTTSDGLRLKGWYIRSQNGAAVISFPGRAASQKRAKMLADNGYGVLLFDRRGEGESEGDPNLFGWQGERDIHAAVEFLQSRPDVDPNRVGGIGLSVGGEMMIEAAAESNALKSIVSEGGSSRSVRDEIANPGGRWQELVGTGFATLGTAVFTSDVPPADLKSLVPKIGSRHVFFIYGEQGQPAEKPANEGFYEEAKGYKEIWEVPGSGHMKGIEAQPQEYERRVVRFFDRALLGDNAR